MKPVEIITVEDGGNPRSNADIETTDAGFLIRPFTEDGDPNYKFRLDVSLENTSPDPVKLPVTIDWADSEYAKYRRYVLLSRGDEWTRLPAEIDGPMARAVIEAPPGLSRLGMHPFYNYTRLRQFAGALDPRLFDVIVLGPSLHGREIVAVEAGRKDRRPLVVMTRAHPYESIGSFMAEGMISWLARDSSDARALMDHHRFAFIPMPNPDGVAEGACKRTAGGLDINLAAGSADPEGCALRAYHARVRPAATFDIHGFMHNSDGFGTNDIARGREIAARLLQRPDLFNKKLSVQESLDTEGGLENLGMFCQMEFGSVRFGGSWTWYDRDAAHLRAMGVEILKAYAAQFA